MADNSADVIIEPEGENVTLVAAEGGGDTEGGEETTSSKGILNCFLAREK